MATCLIYPNSGIYGKGKIIICIEWFIVQEFDKRIVKNTDKIYVSKPSKIWSSVTWLEYCQYGVKPKTINQSIQNIVRRPFSVSRLIIADSCLLFKTIYMCCLGVVTSDELLNVE